MRQLREAVRHHEEESMTFLGLRQLSENIDFRGMEGSSCPEYSKGVRPFSELHAVLCTVSTVADRFVYVVGHLWPIIRFTDMSVHADLSGVAGQFRVVKKVLHTTSERVR